MGLKMLEIDAKITPVGDSRVKLIRDTFGRLSNSVEIRKRFARSA